VQKAFTPRRVEELRGQIESLCGDLVARALARGEIDLVADFALPMPLFVIAEMLGLPMADRRRFGAWSARLVSIVKPLDLVVALPSLWSFMRYMRELARKRRSSSADDLLAIRLDRQRKGRPALRNARSGEHDVNGNMNRASSCGWLRGCARLVRRCLRGARREQRASRSNPFPMAPPCLSYAPWRGRSPPSLPALRTMG
jgi:hypothetical protein